MKKEIRRNDWSQFCRDFSARNQYRSARIRVASKGHKDQVLDGSMPLLGMSVEKKGRQIDGIQVVSVGCDADALMRPLMSLKDPAKVFLEQDGSGTDTRLVVQGKDGTEATLDLIDRADPSVKRRVVEKVAYSLFEKSGHRHGQDLGNWLEAETRVISVEKAFV